VRDEAAAADKEAAVKRVTEEAAVKRAVEEAAMKATKERATEEAVAKAVAAEATGSARGSPAPSQAPPVTGAKRSEAPSGSFLFYSLTTFLSRSTSSNAAAVTGAATADKVVGAAPGPAPISEP
jgi:hypothetical protein